MCPGDLISANGAAIIKPPNYTTTVCDIASRNWYNLYGI